MATTLYDHRRVLVFEYKQHKFYEDPLSDDTPFIHIDNKGRERKTELYSEDEAIQYVDSLED